MKTIDTNEYLSVIRELVQQQKEVSLVVTGNSMAPFLIHQRDTICFKKPESPFKVGDIVFYQRTNGKFVTNDEKVISAEKEKVVNSIIDDFYKSRIQLEKESKERGLSEVDYDSALSIDLECFEKCIDGILENKQVRLPRYSFETIKFNITIFRTRHFHKIVFS